MSLHPVVVPPTDSLAADTEGNLSSGPSPTVHLLGLGKVGRAFLREISGTGIRLVGASDSTATVVDREGLDPLALCAHKERGGSLAAWPRAERVQLELAFGLLGADVVVDALPTDLGRAAAAVQRCKAALRAGSALVLASKDALARAGEVLLAPGTRVGCHAVLGGTGRRLRAELAELRAGCTAIAIAANASTTALVQHLERGASLAAAIRDVQALGLLESDPTLDLDGSDAATKLAIVARAVLDLCCDPRAVPRADIRGLDPALVRERAARGSTTRLVGRADRRGELRVAFEEVPLTSPLAVPSDRVAYTYTLSAGVRVHVGCGVGPIETARALLIDVGAS